jgi:hypothetical protein
LGYFSSSIPYSWTSFTIGFFYRATASGFGQQSIPLLADQKPCLLSEYGTVFKLHVGSAKSDMIKHICQKYIGEIVSRSFQDQSMSKSGGALAVDIGSAQNTDPVR